MTQMNLSTEKYIMHLEKRLGVARGEVEGVGWFGSLGLIDANYCFWNELAMRFCCVALRTLSNNLWWSLIMWEKRMYTCMYNWVALLRSGKLTEHCEPAIMEKKKNHNKKRGQYLKTFSYVYRLLYQNFRVTANPKSTIPTHTNKKKAIQTQHQR